jgi:hypothetical protein
MFYHPVMELQHTDFQNGLIQVQLEVIVCLFILFPSSELTNFLMLQENVMGLEEIC